MLVDVTGSSWRTGVTGGCEGFNVLGRGGEIGVTRKGVGNRCKKQG